jgi:hypothetical protein
MGLATVGAIAALLADSVGWPWLFPVGLGLVVLALVLPSYPGQTLRQKWTHLVRHLPGGRWLSKPDDSPPEP